MPKQERWNIKRHLEQADKALLRAQEHLVQAGNPYETVHPELYEIFLVIFKGIDLCRDSLAKLRERI